jgi:hypothetical protein
MDTTSTTKRTSPYGMRVGISRCAVSRCGLRAWPSGNAGQVPALPGAGTPMTVTPSCSRSSWWRCGSGDGGATGVHSRVRLRRRDLASVARWCVSCLTVGTAR